MHRGDEPDILKVIAGFANAGALGTAYPSLTAIHRLKDSILRTGDKADLGVEHLNPHQIGAYRTRPLVLTLATRGVPSHLPRPRFAAILGFQNNASAAGNVANCFVNKIDVVECRGITATETSRRAAATSALLSTAGGTHVHIHFSPTCAAIGCHKD